MFILHCTSPSRIAVRLSSLQTSLDWNRGVWGQSDVTCSQFLFNFSADLAVSSYTQHALPLHLTTSSVCGSGEREESA